MADVTPVRGDIWLVSFGASSGGEIQKDRPAIIISNDTANALLNRVQVIPVSSQTDRIYPAEALITLNGQQRKAMADQIATISKQRLRRAMGRISAVDLVAVERVVCLQLGL